ncbi:hypothetical protein ABGB12_16065 [Actinocorallia sp. B10E7]|uniref:hypothetical protein n=1 Tax=Actinocorallia sp. B10E7 TaxID=3153558 RepID=UPI00325D625F
MTPRTPSPSRPSTPPPRPAPAPRVTFTPLSRPWPAALTDVGLHTPEPSAIARPHSGVPGPDPVRRSAPRHDVLRARARDHADSASAGAVSGRTPEPRDAGSGDVPHPGGFGVPPRSPRRRDTVRTGIRGCDGVGPQGEPA